ncbi:MAG: DJ-1/PfpI family protein [Lachnospiraceae bacterium]|jgi:4-methyl-5(b-hydroxyethyl)-thiazole monophosphate biosynthesis|nr:DJ-1/PfpI family protein [Lachnospiraceae bacterium]
MKRVCVLLAEGFEEVEALTAVDLLRRAGVYVATVSITGADTVSGSNGISVIADDVFEDFEFEKYDVLLLPGGGPGTENLRAHKGTRTQILEFLNTNRLVAAICAAPTILGDMGLLKGKHAICYPGLEPRLSGALVTVKDVVTDGQIITSRGIGTAIPFALCLIEILVDSAKAQEIGKGVVYYR